MSFSIVILDIYHGKKKNSSIPLENWTSTICTPHAGQGFCFWEAA